MILTNGTFCSPIDEKMNTDENIINKIEEETILQFKIGQVFESAEDCKRSIKYFAETLGFVASVNGQSLVCNQSDVSKERKHQLWTLTLILKGKDATRYPYCVHVNGLSNFNL